MIADPATTLFRNGRIWTLEPGQPDAGELLSRHGRIVRLEGGRRTADRVIDLQGLTVIPGPVDAHCHLVSFGMIRRREADLVGVRTWEELAGRLQRHATERGMRPGGSWLLGRGFDQDLLPGGVWPSREDLDALFPEIPVRITRICGHALIANTAALCLAGIDPNQQEPGYPRGVVTEARMATVFGAVPTPSASEWKEAARWACSEAARVGFVGVHSLMAHREEMKALVDLDRESPLPVRVLMHPPYAMLESLAASGLGSEFGGETLRIGAIKLFSDGSLGARTAALRAPYTDDPTTSGELIYSQEELTDRVRRIYAAGFQTCIHAIGDLAMEVTLEAMEHAAETHPPVLPPRVEHASMVSEDLLQRMLRIGAGAAIQPQFARSDFWSPDRLGPERAKGCYAFRTLWNRGIPLAGSTDCPVERMDAMSAIGQLVSRPDWSPQESIPLADTLRIFSEGSYRLRGYPTGTGALAPGQPADFVVLDQDPRTVPPEAVEHLKVVMTVVGGQVVYQA